MRSQRAWPSCSPAGRAWERSKSGCCAPSTSAVSTPDVIVGTSAGALNAVFIASRPQTVATADALAGIWRDLGRAQVFPLNPVTGLLGFLGARNHVVPESGLRRLISKQIDREQLGEMPIPLHVVAVDVTSGEELLLSHGPVLDAVLASCAVPGILPPVAWEGRTLMDGGGG
jgi:NTE family protein